MITDTDINVAVSAAEGLPPAKGVYIQEDYVMNLLETVIDYQLKTPVVVKALEYFRENRWNEIRTLGDLDDLFAPYSDDTDGNLTLAQYLWGYNLWTRAEQLRGLARYLRGIGVVDREQLREWAHSSTFKDDFEGRVKGLGPGVYQWLVMRQGVDTVKPDVHVRPLRRVRSGAPLKRRGCHRAIFEGRAAPGNQGVRARLAHLGRGAEPCTTAPDLSLLKPIEPRKWTLGLASPLPPIFRV